MNTPRESFVVAALSVAGSVVDECRIGACEKYLGIPPWTYVPETDFPKLLARVSVAIAAALEQELTKGAQ